MKKSILVLLSFVSISTLAVDWPGTGDCASTLQTCIDAQPDPGIITVVTNSTIAGTTFTITKNLSLRAKTAFHPIFNNANIIVGAGPNEKVTIQGFNFHGGSRISGSGQEGSEINIIANTWKFPDTTANSQEGIDIQLAPTLSTDSSTINIKGNNIVGDGSNNFRGFIDVGSISDGLSIVNIIDNHVTVNSENLSIFDNYPAVYVHKIQQGKMDIQIVGNVIRGGSEQIYFNNGAFATSGLVNIGIISNLMSGVIDSDTVTPFESEHSALKMKVDNGAISAIIGNNTLDGIKRNSGSDGTGFDFGDITSSSSVGISLFNNIVVNTARGYKGPASGSATSIVSKGNNVFWNHGTVAGLSLIASDSNSNPKFVQEGINYSLTDGSVSIDRADNAATALLEFGSIWMATAPQIDANGLRRFKGPMTDAGAFEWGDRHVFVKANNPTSNNIPVGDSILNNDTTALPIVTQIWNYQDFSGVYNNQAIGVYRSGASWRIFNENDSVSIPNNAKFHVLHPYGSSADTFNNLAQYNNPSTPDSGFELNDVFLNNNSSAAIFATNYWTGVYNNASLEVAYQTNGIWYLGNVDGSDMPTNTKAFVYAQDTSRNAYLHLVTDDNSTSNSTTLDHPLLNNNACVLPTVMQSTGYLFGPLFENNPTNIGVFYDSVAGRWKIFNQDFSSINITIGGSTTTGGTFYVMVDPQQAYDCNDIIFKSGFE